MTAKLEKIFFLRCFFLSSDRLRSDNSRILNDVSFSELEGILLSFGELQVLGEKSHGFIRGISRLIFVKRDNAICSEYSRLLGHQSFRIEENFLRRTELTGHHADQEHSCIWYFQASITSYCFPIHQVLLNNAMSLPTIQLFGRPGNVICSA